jgi:hypothetical protein
MSIYPFKFQRIVYLFQRAISLTTMPLMNQFCSDLTFQPLKMQHSPYISYFTFCFIYFIQRARMHQAPTIGDLSGMVLCKMFS